MPISRIKTVGWLRNSEETGLEFSILTDDLNQIWIEALANAYDWPGLGKYPEKPKDPKRPQDERIPRNSAGTTGAQEWLERQKTSDGEWRNKKRDQEKDWQQACSAYKQALHADPEYRRAAAQFFKLQAGQPQVLPVHSHWVYRGKVLRVEWTPEHLLEGRIPLIKHYVLRKERLYAKVRREVAAFENMEKLHMTSREAIPDQVRLFVWQRNQGQCVRCGSRERLEFDHIIPVISGGSSTERNVQLLCESCNRSKGSNI